MGPPRFAVLGTLCFLLVSYGASSGAQDSGVRDAESKILAVENAWNLAEAKRDVRALNLIFDDSLIYVDEDGALLTKADFLQRAKAPNVSIQSLETQSMNAQVYGDTAVVSGVYRMKGLQKNKPYQRDGRFVDIWILRNGAWVCVAAQSTPIQR